MKDNNWELINGEAAHEIEFLNFENQVRLIESLVILYTSKFGTGEKGCPGCPTPLILTEMHRTGTLFLLERPGSYRENYNVNVVAGDGTIIYDAPPWERVTELMAEFHVDLASMWNDENAARVSAFALWRVNWIHPFRNGNGRTARAFAYACLCLKLGYFLPGAPTVLDMIMNDRTPYQAALQAADKTYKETGIAQLDDMENYIAELTLKQLQSVQPD